MENEESINVETDRVEMSASQVTVNTGWTTEMAKWNTIGTVAGAILGLASLLVSLLALSFAMHK